MRLPRMTIGRLMLGVAVIAVLLASFGVAGAIAVMGLALLVLPLILLAPPGRRLLVSTCIASLLPVLAPFCLYAAWVIAWGILGHRPRSRLDDPKYISPFLLVPYFMTTLALVTLLISPIVCVVLAIVPGGHRGDRLLLLLSMPSVWLLVFAFLKWDPLWVMEWFMD